MPASPQLKSVPLVIGSANDPGTEGDLPSDERHQVIRSSIVGYHQPFSGPFGEKLSVYADWVASGRTTTLIEREIENRVLPTYGNTHTESSYTGRRSTLLREDARRIIKKSIGADDRDALIFTGSGSTAAVNKLIEILNLRIPNDLAETYQLTNSIPANARPLVIVGPFEHHSNELPWRETIADVVSVPEGGDGRVCLDGLRQVLQRYRQRPMKIGSFSAASNVTGILSDVRGVTSVLHEHGALAFWDFATAAPYVELRISPSDPADFEQYAIDAAFISTHKFIGGPGTPGILVAKKALMKNTVPATPGGGTIRFVTRSSHEYSEHPEEREEGGTPDVVGSIRAGLVFLMRDQVSVETIGTREREFARLAVQRLDRNPKIWVLGNLETPRLPIVSFLIRHGEEFLHWNFVVALLNDLFGIQSRGGCSCAGPYGHALFGINDMQSAAFVQEVSRSGEGIKPGWCRISFNYFTSEAEVDYVLEAIELIADYGHRLIDDYVFDPKSGRWTHHKGNETDLESLDAVDLFSEEAADREVAGFPHDPARQLQEQLDEAKGILMGASSKPRIFSTASRLSFSPNFERLRWFPVPFRRKTPRIEGN